MKEKLKELWQSFKKSQDKKKHLQEIKNKAYYEKMKERAEWMGQRQAILDTEHREKIYKDKLKRTRQQINTQQNRVLQEKVFNPITGKWSSE